MQSYIYYLILILCGCKTSTRSDVFGIECDFNLDLHFDFAYDHNCDRYTVPAIIIL